MLTQHFALSELDCSCGCSLPPRILERLRRVAYALEVIRSEIGQPLAVISGYRCASRNRVVGGAPASRHLLGDAVDLQSQGLTGVELRAVIERLIRDRRIPEGGVGTYASKVLTCHYDLRPTKARWHG